MTQQISKQCWENVKNSVQANWKNFDLGNETYCRRELEFLRSQQQRASEVRSAEEVQRKVELEASHQQLELQKKYLEEIRQEQEQARERAEEEIRQVN